MSAGENSLALNFFEPFISNGAIMGTVSMLVTTIYNMVDTYFVGTLGESQQADQNEEEASEYVSSAFFVGLAIGTISRVGFPAVVRQGLSSISSGLLNNLTRPYGDAAIAAMSVVNRFAAFVMCVGLEVGQGYQPVASFNYQAKEYKRVKKGLLVTMAIGFCFISCLAIPGFIFAEEVIHLFQKSEQVKEIGVYSNFDCYDTFLWNCRNTDFAAIGGYAYGFC